MRRRKRSYVIKDPDAERRSYIWRAWLVRFGLILTHGYLMKADSMPPRAMPLDFDFDKTLEAQWFDVWYSSDGNSTAQAQPADEQWRNWRYLIRIEDEHVEVYDTQDVCVEYLKKVLVGEREPHVRCQAPNYPPF